MPTVAQLMVGKRMLERLTGSTEAKNNPLRVTSMADVKTLVRIEGGQTNHTKACLEAMIGRPITSLEAVDLISLN